jgi:hypothetical protein
LRGLRGLSAKKIHFVLDVTREKRIHCKSQETTKETTMKLIILTYTTGYQQAYFKDDPRLIDTLLADLRDIDDMQEVDYEGRLFTPERAMREFIRQQGKVLARKTFEYMMAELEADMAQKKIYFQKQEK